MVTLTLTLAKHFCVIDLLVGVDFWVGIYGDKSLKF